MSWVSRAMASLAVRLQVLESAHVVQAVSQLDEHDPHIGHHGQQHLADVFCLAVLAVGKLDFVDFGDALDNVGHLVAKAGRNFFIGGGRVLDRVVQQSSGDGRRVHLHLRQHLSHFERVNDVGFAGSSHLAVMMADTELQALRIRETSSLGRLAWTWRSSVSKRSEIEGWGMRFHSSAAACKSLKESGGGCEHLPVWPAGHSPCFIIGRIG